jgi:hypothetical protein
VEPRIPERNKRASLVYAVTDDGLELPVIDITHPAFACEMTEAEISAVIDQTMQGLRESSKMSPDAIKELPRRSILWRGTFESLGTFMSGMMTYLTRLGPENLGDGYANELDRSYAATIMPLTFRFRLRDVARQLAWALSPALSDLPGRPVELVNLAGGAAMDSLNALLLLRRHRPESLSGRAIRIQVLDVDEAGPHFGARALEALRAPGAALAGLDIVLEHVPYDWSNADALRPILSGFTPSAITAGSTEGGLFDYGSDEAIVSNLRVLHEATPEGFAMVGSVVRDLATLDSRLHVTATMKARPAVRWLGLTAFEALAQQARWQIARTIDSTAHHVVALRKLADPASRREAGV